MNFLDDDSPEYPCPECPGGWGGAPVDVNFVGMFQTLQNIQLKSVGMYKWRWSMQMKNIDFAKFLFRWRIQF